MNQLVNFFRNARKKSNLSRSNRNRSQRRLHSETLEKRELLAGDLLAGHNYAIAADVNSDYKVTAIDALLVINQLKRNGGSQLLAGEARGELDNYYDVNADNEITPLDALRVLNEMRTPEGAPDDLVEFLINPRTEDDQAFPASEFNQATRTLTVGVGEVFNLELNYNDLRAFDASGLFTISSNFVTNQANTLEPVLIETQQVSLSGQLRKIVLGGSGNVILSMPGETSVTVPFNTFFSSPTNEISKALVSFGFTTDQFQVSNISLADPTGATNETVIQRDYQVNFTDLALADTNIPNLTISTSATQDSAGAPVAVTSTSTQINPRNADGTINQRAIPLNIDFRSRSLPGNTTYYGLAGLVTGTFDPATGFLGVSAVGQANPDGVPNFSNPFDALSIPVRVIRPTTGLRVTLTPTDNSATPITLYGNDAPVPTDMLLYNTTNDPNDATDGFAILNIVAVGQPITVTANDATLNFTEDAAARNVNLTALTTVAGSTDAPVFTITTQPARGTATINGSVVTYTPAADDFTPPALSFVYTATVGTSSDTGTVTVNIAGVNDPPIFFADTTRAATRAVPLTIVGSTLLANDRPGPANETGTVTISAVTPTSANGGTVALVGQNIVYTSAPTFVGADVVTYTISDGSAANGTATATLNINVVAPTTVVVTAGDSSLTFAEDDPARTLDLSTLTTVVGSNAAVTYSIVTQPARGTLTLNGSTATYRPAADDFTTTPLSFVYRAQVGGTAASPGDNGTVTINITPVNDPPVFVADAPVTTTRGTALTVTGSTLLANDLPGPANESGTVSIAGVTAATAQGGTVRLVGQNIIYTPAATYVGPDIITYTISDGGTDTTTASLAVTVSAPGTVTVTADNRSLSFVEDGDAKTLNLNALTTVTGSTTTPTFTIVTQPARGTLTLSGPAITYTPAADDFTTAPLTVVYRASVGSESDTGTISISIAPVNDPPVFVADAARSTDRGVPLTISVASLLANDRPGPANETGTVTLATTPAPRATNGTVAVSGGNLVYTPAANFTGSSTITYTITDGASENATTTATLSVSVVAPNVVTVTAGNATLNFAEDDAAKTLDLATLTTVSNSTAAATFTIVTPPALGQVTITGSTISYTPPANVFTTAPLTLVYRATVGSVSDTGTVSINISAVNDPPIATADTVFALVDVTSTYAATVFLANDRPGPANETQTLSLTAVSAITGANATQGTVTLAANGSVLYTPAAGFVGTDRFQYTVSDGTASTTGVVTVTVANFRPSVISGQIFMDLIQSLDDQTRDGIRQVASEPGIAGLQVKLSAAGKPDAFAYTDLDGQYRFNVTSPGTYTVTFVVPDTVVGGVSRGGTAGATALSSTSIRVTVGQNGNVTSTNNNFTILGTQGVATFTGIGYNPLDILVIPYDPSELNGGGVAVLDVNGNQQLIDFSDNGYTDIKFAELSLNSTNDQALLTILGNDDTVTTLLLDSDEFMVSEDGRVVTILGAASDFDAATGTPAQLRAQFGDYRDNVDAILAGM